MCSPLCHITEAGFEPLILLPLLLFFLLSFPSLPSRLRFLLSCSSSWLNRNLLRGRGWLECHLFLLLSPENECWGTERGIYHPAQLLMAFFVCFVLQDREPVNVPIQTDISSWMSLHLIPSSPSSPPSGLRQSSNPRYFSPGLSQQPTSLHSKGRVL